MASPSKKTPVPSPKKGTPQSQRSFLFDRKNYVIMIAGLVIFLIGLLLMSGGGSRNPEVFNPSRIYSFRRITLAPIVVILGLVVEIFAIMRKPRVSQ